MANGINGITTGDFITLNNSSMDLINPSISTQYTSIASRDNQQQTVSSLFTDLGSSKTAFVMEANCKKSTDNTRIMNQLRVQANRNGTCSYEVTDPAAFRSAINAASQVNFPSNIKMCNIATNDTTNGFSITIPEGTSCNVLYFDLAQRLYLLTHTTTQQNFTITKISGPSFTATASGPTGIQLRVGN